MKIDWIKGLWGRAPMDPYRWVVLDVETTGLNTRKASLIEIAALSLHLDPITQFSSNTLQKLQIKKIFFFMVSA
ncbi:MAG: hypothetical protein B7Y55_08790 [Polynucleobacter sp. 35-46-207]|nr:MAG: hypothetical protein B7Y55_08790 [Polynucleobacter sp. 35-46-207]